MKTLLSIGLALSRARTMILTMAAVYAISVISGIAMAHSGNEFALSQRDSLVARAHASDPAAIAYQQGDGFRGALFDFGENLFLGAVPSTVGGLAIVIPYATAAYRGWVGGIVSVDRDHSSRLTNPFSAAYYIITLILQLIPYSMAGGAGVNLGFAYLRPPPCYRGDNWLGIPKEAIRDVFRIYLLIVPLFLIASLWEFLSPWN